MAIWRKHKVESWLLSRISPGYRLKGKYMSALHSKSSRYFVAIAAIAVAFAARFLLEPALGNVAPLLVFTLSVMVAAWYGGLGPGLLATALSLLLGDYFFIAESAAERIEEVLFLGIGISISILSQVRLSLEAKRQQLLASEQEARKTAEDARRTAEDARRKAEDANRLKDEFLSTVSHELRTPLTAINGWALMLREGRLDAAQSERALETIVRSARSQNQLIDDLLDVSRIITGKMGLAIVPLNLGLVIKAAIETVRPAAEAKGIRLSALIAPEAEEVSGDTERLQQVVWNLLSNAVKFAPNGGRVEVRLERADSHVEIVVADNGQGISPEFLPHVFERFRQEDSGTSRQQGGLGLGLAIVRNIVELHGGTVHAASEGLGKGATFTVTLPIATARPVAPEELRDKAAGGRLAPEKPSALAGVRALFVDDEADAREIISMMLAQGGAEVRTAVSTTEALASCDEWRPDVLISDIGMPGEDGYTLMKKLRARESERGGHIPAIALTAYGRGEDCRHALSVGYEYHIPKPVEPEDLMVAVASLANRTGK
jgi:signal transduction histidine kinase/ActR/RegA family two-component response regulator